MSLDVEFVDGRRTMRFRTHPLLVPPSPDGLFEPGSVIRRVYSDSVCLLGAGTALLLQLAHPAIAAGVHDHSDYEHRPLGRLFGTVLATNTVVFGSRHEVEELRATMLRVHSRVTGPGYRALDPELLCWVNATLFGTAANLYQRLVRPLTEDELDAFARDSRHVAEVFGCPIESQPSSWRDFDAYWNEMLDTLTVTPTARAVAGSLLSGQGLPARPAWGPPLGVARAVTAATLPRRLRREYALPWRGRDRMLARTVLGSAGTVLPRLPDRWRQLGPELLRSPQR